MKWDVLTVALYMVRQIVFTFLVMATTIAQTHDIQHGLLSFKLVNCANNNNQHTVIRLICSINPFGKTDVFRFASDIDKLLS